MNNWYLIIFTIIVSSCYSNKINEAEKLAKIKCEMVEIIMRESATNPKAQELYDAKKKTYDSLYEHYKTIYRDSASWLKFEKEVKRIEEECPSNILSNTTKKPN